MSVSPEQLMEELRTLCRGRGVQTPGIDLHVGPALRQVCGVVETDGAEAVRTKLRDWVTNAARGFPVEVRSAVLAPLGLHEEAQFRFLNERIEWLAKQQDRGARTVRRRMEAGLQRLVEVALQPAPSTAHVAPSELWHVKEFDALLKLDGPTPACTERRTVVADTDGVNEIAWSITIPSPTPDGAPGDLDVEVLHGVELIGHERPSPRRFLMKLRLPRPLNTGQTHQFALEVRVPRGQSMRPTYVFWPERMCESFRLRVRFDRDDLPDSVWRVEEALARDTDDLTPWPRKLPVDEIGEIDVSFPHPRQGRGYGVQWSPRV
ncbi:hypothetical protein ACWGE0_19390 [Lentzea sp. NPDC054927]